MASKPSKRISDVQASKQATTPKSTWKPTPEAAAKASRLRLVSWIVWAVAIGLEIFAIFWVLKQVPVVTWLLVVLIIVAGALSVAGSLCWKQANRLSPASEENRVQFFVQNQLGAIVSIVAFLPLIILIFMNKNMDGKQKAIAGGIGVVVLLVAAAFGISYQSPSQEQYAAETNVIEQLTGEDVVFWTKSGSVFHVCDAVPDVNKESQDGTIYRGTVAAAHEAGKDRLTKRWQSEATNYCGYSAEEVAAVEAAVESPGTNTDDTTDPVENVDNSENTSSDTTGDNTDAPATEQE